MRNYSELEIDAIREMVNIGTANAATALSQMIDRKVMINIPYAKMIPMTDIPGLLAGHNQVIKGLYFKMHGDLTGSILLFYPEEIAEKMADFLVTDLDEKKEDSAEIRKSALMEMGNILTNSYINAMAGLLDYRILISPPFFASDYLESVIDYLLIEIAEKADSCLFMETSMLSEGESLKGNFIVFFDDASLDLMLHKMGIK